MPLTLTNLDVRTRELMLEELNADIASKHLYFSSRLSAVGLKDFPGLLKEAVANHDDAWLAAELNTNERLLSIKPRRTVKGGYTIAAVPENAAEILAESEFNRYYIRGLCRKAIEQGKGEVEIYRAKSVATPRAWSERRIGRRIDAAALLRDLRSHEAPSRFRLPAGANSGLSVKLIGETVAG
ncbi:MAG: hypothetical protein IAF08_03245 [Rhizobacter sp.]|nr:hypothetical protein [Chlorobiales bacterium]